MSPCKAAKPEGEGIAEADCDDQLAPLEYPEVPLEAVLDPDDLSLLLSEPDSCASL